MLDQILVDLRYGVRQLARAPLFTLIASLCVAVGITVAVAAFSTVNAMIFQVPRVADPDGLYHLYTSDGGGRDRAYGASSYADYQDFARTGGFASLAATDYSTVITTVDNSPPQNEYLSFVSPNYFTVLGLRLERGRSFHEAGENPEIVITHRYWQRAFNGEPAVVGRTMRVNGRELSVIGVAPDSYRGMGIGLPIIGWVPAPQLPLVTGSEHGISSRGSRGFRVFGRLAPGKTPEAAVTELNALAAGLAEQYPHNWIDDEKQTRLVSILSQRESVATPDVRAGLFGAVGIAALVVSFVLLLACTNVAALLIGRAVARRHEVAVRLTMGASRARLLRQLMTESVLLAAISGALAVLTLLWTFRLVRRVPLLDMVYLQMDGRVLLVAVIVSLLCALLFGLAPAWQSLRVDLRVGLAGITTLAQRNRLRGFLIALQVAISCVLIMLAFTAVRGARSHVASNPGVAVDGVLMVNIDLRSLGHDSIRETTYVAQVQELMRGLPGVLSVSTTRMTPLGNSRTEAFLTMPGRDERLIELNPVGPAFFQTMSLNPLRGRVFDAHDRLGSTPVVVVNQTFLRQYGDAILGQVVTIDSVPGYQIVGVVPDVNYHGMNEPIRAMMYSVDEQMTWTSDRYVILARVTPGAETAAMNALREQLRARYPDLVVPNISTMREHYALQTMPQRIAGRVILGMGAVELALASIGLYGLLLYALLARRREIGVRLAIGATPRDASWAVLRDGLKYAFYGAIAGLLVAVPAAIVAQQAVPGARAADPVPFVAAVIGVLGSAIVAAYLPARRASRVQPAAALRHE